MSKILFWAGFGVAVRFWTLSIQNRPYIQRNMNSIGRLAAYGAVGGAFGYWLQGVEQNQTTAIQQLKERLLEKRRRVAESEASESS